MFNMKLKVNVILENNDVMMKNKKTTNAEITLNKKSSGLDKRFNKKREKIKPSFLTTIQNLFKTQSILHFTFDYLFFFLIR